MRLDLNTFLTALYYFVDELYMENFAPYKRRGSGRKTVLSDSEVLTLALLGQWHKRRSETDFLRFVNANWREYFPRLLSQSAFNKRVRDLTGILCQLGPALAKKLSTWIGQNTSYQVTDSLPIPLMRICRGKKKKLFPNEATLGHDHLDKTTYYGVKLFASVDDTGAVNGFVFGPANTEEHFLAEAFFAWRANPENSQPDADQLTDILGKTHKKGGKRTGVTGRMCGLGVGKKYEGPYISDLGLRGANWQNHWSKDFGAKLLTAEAYQKLDDEERIKSCRWLSSLRQKVETSFNWLVDELGLRKPGARSFVGLAARIGAKMAALNAMLLINYCCDRPPYRFFDPLYGC